MSTTADTPTTSAPTAPAQPPRWRTSGRDRPRTVAELAAAPFLRPAEVYLLTGIKRSLLSTFLLLPEAERLPSRKIAGRKGGKGARLIERTTLFLWLEWKDWHDNVDPAEAETLALPEYASFPVWRAQREQRERAAAAAKTTSITKGGRAA